MQEPELREYVRKKLRRHHALFEGVWSLLLRGQYVEDVLVGAAEPDSLVERAREILGSGAEVEKTAGSADDREPRTGNERGWALSQLVAHHAAADPDVVAFRDDHLPDGLIPWSDVESWINERADEDGERTSDVSFTIPPGTMVEWSGPTVRFAPPIAEVATGIRFSSRILAYARLADRAVRRRTVTAGGVLDRLGQLGEGLAGAFGWQPAQATVFILTGVTPMIVTARIDVPFKVRHEVRLDWARRITLDLDPGASRQEVLEAFEHARREYDGHPRPQRTPARQTGRRRTTVKHLRLAAFTGAEHADKPWVERFRLWNERFPEWAYPAQSNFRRDAASAQRRLLSP